MFCFSHFFLFPHTYRHTNNKRTLSCRPNNNKALGLYAWTGSKCFADCFSVIMIVFVGNRAKMSLMLLQLSLCVLTAIQLTSSQTTYDIIQPENDVNSCGSTEEMLSKLMTAVSESLKYDITSRERSERMFSQLMSALTQLKLSDANSSNHTHEVLNLLMTSVSQLQQNVSQLQQSDVNSSNRTDHVLNQLMTAVSQLQQNVSQLQQLMVITSQLQAAVSQLQVANSQLLRELAEVKAAVTQEDVTGEFGNEKCLSRSEVRTSASV